jgi:hypothetical protein
VEEQGGQGGMICGKCGASFETQEELDQHMRDTHPDEGMEEGMQQQ